MSRQVTILFLAGLLGLAQSATSTIAPTGDVQGTGPNKLLRQLDGAILIEVTAVPLGTDPSAITVRLDGNPCSSTLLCRNLLAATVPASLTSLGSHDLSVVCAGTALPSFSMSVVQRPGTPDGCVEFVSEQAGVILMCFFKGLQCIERDLQIANLTDTDRILVLEALANAKESARALKMRTVETLRILQSDGIMCVASLVGSFPASTLKEADESIDSIIDARIKEVVQTANSFVVSIRDEGLFHSERKCKLSTKILQNRQTNITATFGQKKVDVGPIGGPPVVALHTTVDLSVPTETVQGDRDCLLGAAGISKIDLKIRYRAVVINSTTGAALFVSNFPTVVFETRQQVLLRQREMWKTGPIDLDNDIDALAATLPPGQKVDRTRVYALAINDAADTCGCFAEDRGGGIIDLANKAFDPFMPFGCVARLEVTEKTERKFGVNLRADWKLTFQFRTGLENPTEVLESEVSARADILNAATGGVITGSPVSWPLSPITIVVNPVTGVTTDTTQCADNRTISKTFNGADSPVSDRQGVGWDFATMNHCTRKTIGLVPTTFIQVPTMEIRISCRGSVLDELQQVRCGDGQQFFFHQK